MKYLITIAIESDKPLQPQNLQRCKCIAEESVIETIKMPTGANVFINTKVTKE